MHQYHLQLEYESLPSSTHWYWVLDKGIAKYGWLLQVSQLYKHKFSKMVM